MLEIARRKSYLTKRWSDGWGNHLAISTKSSVNIESSPPRTKTWNVVETGSSLLGENCGGQISIQKCDTNHRRLFSTRVFINRRVQSAHLKDGIMVTWCTNIIVIIQHELSNLIFGKKNLLKHIEIFRNSIFIVIACKPTAGHSRLVSQRHRR